MMHPGGEEKFSSDYGSCRNAAFRTSTQLRPQNKARRVARAFIRQITLVNKESPEPVVEKWPGYISIPLILAATAGLWTLLIWGASALFKIIF